MLLNGQKIRGTGKDRKLTTPPLPGNREYQYWVTATFNRGGQTVTEYRKVDLGAGESTRCRFHHSARAESDQTARRPGGSK